jgi:hypothetical protein
MRRKNRRKIEHRVRAGQCILDVDVRDPAGNPTGEKEPCGNPCVSRGLCDKHRQRWYLELRKQPSKAAKTEFEQRCIQLGLILPEGEQAEWTHENPFAGAVS